MLRINSLTGINFFKPVEKHKGSIRSLEDIAAPLPDNLPSCRAVTYNQKTKRMDQDKAVGDTAKRRPRQFSPPAQPWSRNNEILGLFRNGNELLSTGCGRSVESSVYTKVHQHVEYRPTADHGCAVGFERGLVKENSNHFDVLGNTHQLAHTVGTTKNITQDNRLDGIYSPCHSSVILDGYHALDRMAYGRAAINMSHIAVRNLASVMLPTILRQAIGNLLDQALKQGLNEARRAALGAMFMAVPVVGQLALGVADELQGRATNYSRATRAVMMGLSLATGGAALATQSMINPGMRFSEAVLYPVLRDLIQTAFPIVSNPEVGPTKRSLLVAGTLYAANQLIVSRGFVSLPDAIVQEDGVHNLSVTGLIGRGAMNAAGEILDLYAFCMSNHIIHNGRQTEQPQLRIKTPDRLSQAYRDRSMLDVMFSRGSFVSAFGQLYDSMPAAGPLANTLNTVLGRLHSSVAIDWITEAAAALLTVIAYPFWPDPLHQRKIDLQQASNFKNWNSAPDVQQHNEPGLADSLELRQSTVHTISFYPAA